MDTLLNIGGYIGSILLVVSFMLVTRGKWKPQSKYYLFANLIGATLLAIYQFWLGAYAGVLLNVVFASVALWGIITYWPSIKSSSKKRKT
ncbi:MAG: hypothetical protein QG562_569 [Patescibacteria group bacterium]|nr:hypothetical protein [Patescibacteria group bacterium]MDQ5958750.1 hypothetical protein [Patescibacteria group bacterium]